MDGGQTTKVGLAAVLLVAAAGASWWFLRAEPPPPPPQEEVDLSEADPSREETENLMREIGYVQ
ncbi:MAG: hypothetical protein CL927_15615 [Deltaproteobacteria bacterium]|nr:hypothetical protein [Deltaproteobacteria bacterium]HCH65089.1 hypothetical protein [Deltaproteobacteria bacterium]